MTKDRLVKCIFNCEFCFEKGLVSPTDFKEYDPNPGVHHKFPPIGTFRNTKVLFICDSPAYYTSPRKNNVDHHNHTMRSLAHFSQISNNRGRGGERYIRLELDYPHPQFKWEDFYEHHAQIVNDTFGAPFEKYALAVEMYFCATVDGKPKNDDWPCAHRFLWRIIKYSQPEFMVTFGNRIPVFSDGTSRHGSRLLVLKIGGSRLRHTSFTCRGKVTARPMTEFSWTGLPPPSAPYGTARHRRCRIRADTGFSNCGCTSQGSEGGG